MGCIKCGLMVSPASCLQFHGIGKNSDLIFYPKTPEQSAFIKGSIIDMQSANVVIRIYEALSDPSLKRRLEDWPCFVDLALKCWELAK